MQIWRKFVLKDFRHNSEEQEAALPQPCAPHVHSGKRLRHHVGEVYPEMVRADRLCERADGVHRNTAKFLLLAFAREYEEVLEPVHCRLEVWKELFFRGMCGRTDRADDDSFDRERRSVQQNRETLHDEGEVLVDDVA